VFGERLIGIKHVKASGESPVLWGGKCCQGQPSDGNCN